MYKMNAYVFETHSFADVAKIFLPTWQMHGDMDRLFAASGMLATHVPVAYHSFGERMFHLLPGADAPEVLVEEPGCEWTLLTADNLASLTCISASSGSELTVVCRPSKLPRWEVTLLLPSGDNGEEYRGMYAESFFGAADAAV